MKPQLLDSFNGENVNLPSPSDLVAHSGDVG